MGGGMVRRVVGEMRWVALMMLGSAVCGEDHATAGEIERQISDVDAQVDVTLGDDFDPLSQTADPKNCDGPKGGWMDVDWIGLEPICVADFALLCGAGAILLWLLVAWVVCRRRGTGHFARHDGVPDSGTSDLENAKLARQLDAERMTPKWPSPMQPSTPSALTLIARLQSTGHVSGMFPARCVRLIAPKKDYDAEVLGFSDGNTRAEVDLEHLAVEAFHITIAVGDVVIVENRSDTHWWQGYVEQKVEDRKELASDGDGSSYMEKVRNARRLRLQAKAGSGTLGVEAEVKKRCKPDTGIRISAHADKTGVMSIRANVPNVWCSAPRVRWYRLQREDLPAQKRFTEGQGDASEIGSGLTYQVQKEDQGSFIGCGLTCGCKRGDSDCERGGDCVAPLHLLEANCLCRDGWLGLGLYGRDGMVAKDPYDLVPKGTVQRRTGV